MPPQVAAASDPALPPSPPADLPWLQPYPDRLLEPVASAEEEPGAVVVARETIELAFLAAIQLLPPRQRAVLILRDVLGWSAKDTASLLEASVASVNSALQRARATLRERLPERGTEWGRAGRRPRTSVSSCGATWRPTKGPISTPWPSSYARTRSWSCLLTRPGSTDARRSWWRCDRASTPEFGELRTVVTAANTQPATAHYLRQPGESDFKALALDVLRVEGGRIAEITSFVSPELFPAFGLPLTLDR